MNIDKADWYKNRILWKASQHKLLLDGSHCFADESLSELQRKSVHEAAPDLDIVLLFWRDPDQWTALGSRSVCSKHEGKLVVAELDEINKQLTLERNQDMSGQDAKRLSEFIYLDKLDKRIWAPSGNAILSLMNILRMFPLAKKLIA